MIPIKLTIEGLYSYQEKQTIDFTSLIEAGLFGIFGRVGSGKSSILEAISFGLYGESERLNAKDNRAYNMMNLKSNRSLIDFEFFNFKDEKYRIYREFKRNSKRFDDVKRGEAILYQWKEGEWVPLPDLNIEGVIGLSYENFKRTIIIPQGQFKEFLELGGTARTKMMQQIFGLDKFDLSFKVKGILAETKQNFDQLQGQLQSYSLINQELLDIKESEYSKSEALQEQLTEHFKHENTVFQQLKAVKDDFDTLVLRREDVSKLEADVPAINDKKQELIRYENLDKVFRIPLKEADAIQSQWQSKQNLYAQFSKEVEEVSKEFVQVESTLKSIQLEYATLEQKKAEFYEFGLIRDIKKLFVQQNDIEQGMTSSNQLVKTAGDKLVESQQLLSQKEQELNAVKQSRLDTNLLLSIDTWFQQFDYLNKTIFDYKESLDKANAEIGKIESQIKGLRLKNPSNWKNEIAEFHSLFNNKQEVLEEEIRHLAVSHQLTQFANDLQQGTPCPLCGSLSHPNLLQGQDVAKTIEDRESKLKDIKDKQKRLVGYESKARGLFEQYSFYGNQKSEVGQKYSSLQHELQQHTLQYQWGNYVSLGDTNQLVQLKQKASEVQKQIELLESHCKQLRNEVEQNRLSVEKATSDFRTYELTHTKVQSEIHSKSTQIIRLNLNSYLTLADSLIEQEAQQREQKIKWIEAEHTKVTARFQELSSQLTALQTKCKSAEEESKELESANKVLQDHIATLLNTHAIESIEEVKQVLNIAIDISEQRNFIHEFETKLAVVRSQVLNLEEKLAKVSFDKERFEKQEVLVAKLELELKEATEVAAKLKGEIERIKLDLNTKAKLLVEYDGLEKRLKNITVLKNMFDGAGFVNYVSSIYLKNLCDMANHRFHRLTNNQLSLQLNENNDFEIIDYLNEGKSRSVKTLSGGQSFQVSLSLALALAESVQSLSKSNKNFFFIDEGFGTQDTESVNVVFETLSNLHKENRIVGIISHVDELQERMPISLSVVKDEENGSMITVNNV
ncbi:SMC family ATPase [Myroides sp. BIT-d1]|uniref:SMC family ATPase n=1 Tax=Myroides albus TaxID=2562892 RepID=A0A6I3LSN8_9FLAO|nr:SMC family ATPase [Myroides albus]MTG99005.1 SMC family ATPase [Myroides albus]